MRTTLIISLISTALLGTAACSNDHKDKAADKFEKAADNVKEQREDVREAQKDVVDEQKDVAVQKQELAKARPTWASRVASTPPASTRAWRSSTRA